MLKYCIVLAVLVASTYAGPAIPPIEVTEIGVGQPCEIYKYEWTGEGFNCNDHEPISKEQGKIFYLGRTMACFVNDNEETGHRGHFNHCGLCFNSQFTCSLDDELCDLKDFDGHAYDAKCY
ncbi:hypothetical protein BC940DRAFT_307818 [Gongronella butleri]|nr:hypothetical protein BC940DRAFT_307818 [Gongronella butleri]